MHLTRAITSCAAVSVCVLVSAACQEKEAAGDTPYAAQVRTAIPLIENAIGLRFKQPPKVETRSRDQVRQFVISQITDPRAQREFTGMEAVYKRLGMIPDTLKLRDFLVDLLEEQVVGYYDPKTKVLYVVEGADENMAQVTITHELIHALQDQYISLDSIQQLEGQNDRAVAAQAAFEGQATYEQIATMLGGSNVALNFPGGWDRIRDMIRDNQSSMPVFASAPLVLQETLIFPYLSGAEFVRAFKDRSAGKSLYSDLPVSTEQVMHPAAFFARRDTPTVVTIPPLRGGTPAYQNGLGEFETRLFLYQHLEDLNEAMRGAAGWDGDRYALFNTSGGQGLVWASVWDSPVHASEFFDLLNEAVRKRYNVTSASAAGSTARNYSGSGRTVQVSSAEIGGRPLVVYVDVPAGASTAVIDPALIKLQ